MSHLVHLAGAAIRVGSVIRQRCAWCGALIEEMDVALVAVPEGDPAPWELTEDGGPLPRWVGLVAIEEHGDGQMFGVVAKWKVDRVEDDDSIPPDSCMALPAEVTG